MRILLADDHVLVRDALKALFEREEPGSAVLAADDLPAAIDLMSQEGPVDLAILDVNMPGMNGVEGLKIFSARFPGTAVALMSGTAERDLVRRAIEIGAVGYFPKTIAGRALLGAIRLVLSGERFLPASFGFAPDEATAYVGPPDDPGRSSGAIILTRRERDVLGLLRTGAPNKIIARKLDLQEVTVKLHIRGICRKLGAANRTQAALRAVELGISA